MRSALLTLVAFGRSNDASCCRWRSERLRSRTLFDLQIGSVTAVSAVLLDALRHRLSRVLPQPLPDDEWDQDEGDQHHPTRNGCDTGGEACRAEQKRPHYGHHFSCVCQSHDELSVQTVASYGCSRMHTQGSPLHNG